LRVGETQKPRTRTLGSGLRDAVKGFVGTIPDAQQFVRRWLPASKGPHRKSPDRIEKRPGETNAGKRWDPADLFFLISAVDRGLSIEEVAGFLQRPANEVQEKARGLVRR
jgi:hypothetical protein